MLIVAIIIAGFVILAYRRKPDTSLAQPAGQRVLVGIQVVCGDCSDPNRTGDIAIRTCLDINGNCERCGGKSYVLASELAAGRERAARVKHAASSIKRNESRVLAFEAIQKSGRKARG